MWQTSLNLQAAGAQQLNPMLVRFLEFAPEFQEALQTPGRLADPRECSATLKGPCHSHHMPVSLSSHTWGREKASHTVPQLHK